jgi:uncharacterized membrane protein YsdA (DUF1294 family)
MLKRRPRTFFALVFIVFAGGAAFILRRYLGWDWPAVILVALNLAVFPLWGFDKWQAVRQGRRVPELVLHLVACCGTALASLAAMRLFRHKTRKRHFWWLYFAFLALQIGLAGYMLNGR